MQRIACRYHRDSSSRLTSHTELRALFVSAARLAMLPLGEDRHTIVLGPALPSGATSEAERMVFALLEPHDPGEVCRRINMHLPSGIHLESAWVAHPGGPDENPAHLDEAAYRVCWQGAPSGETLSTRIQEFLMTSVVLLTRVREKKTQQLDARALTREVRLLSHRDGLAHVLMTVSVGPQGSLRPEELLTVLGYPPASEEIHVHRIALYQSIWRHPPSPRRAVCWRRPG